MSKPFYVAPDSPNVLVLEQFVAIEVVSDDEQRSPIMGQACRVELPSGEVYVAVTNAAGRIVFGGLALDATKCSVELLPSLPKDHRSKDGAGSPEAAEGEDHDAVTDLGSAVEDVDEETDEGPELSPDSGGCCGEIEGDPDEA